MQKIWYFHELGVAKLGRRQTVVFVHVFHGALSQRQWHRVLFEHVGGGPHVCPVLADGHVVAARIHVNLLDHMLFLQL